jgi:hypothetical protein
VDYLGFRAVLTTDLDVGLDIGVREDTPIPFLGLESAASGAADALLDDALRMISADSCRLATIIDAYASCAQGLQMRRRLEDRSSEPPFRLQKDARWVE